jgi:hypothetical protein
MENFKLNQEPVRFGNSSAGFWLQGEFAAMRNACTLKAGLNRVGA